MNFRLYQIEFRSKVSLKKVGLLVFVPLWFGLSLFDNEMGIWWVSHEYHRILPPLLKNLSSLNLKIGLRMVCWICCMLISCTCLNYSNMFRCGCGNRLHMNLFWQSIRKETSKQVINGLWSCELQLLENFNLFGMESMIINESPWSYLRNQDTSVGSLTWVQLRHPLVSLRRISGMVRSIW